MWGAGGVSTGQWPERREGKSASSLKMVPKMKSVPVMGRLGGGGSVPFEDGSPVGRCQMSEQLVCFHISKARG